ncbi:SRPBCC family protein [Dictyobacter arantiisoli]|uniref:Coenzyme Q-binding protein COQ10 START domain-containing protein n=1 Tax=Dictyobacter arantiisoli TaxID=2014874 RepID=A0A5A5TAA7_9CHLR|nr:SRPBCC family protein [Dictyobacter arantiisoli]GCF07909.1 hypothetical protein KDI_14730 [Dictyobacter arantiisoli]
MQDKYTNHHAETIVNAPVHQVYTLFTHFNDFPKFMSFVKEVTYHDDKSSHWVADVVGRHEWDAVNEKFIPDRQIGWRSTSGLKNFGTVTFTSTSPEQTKVDVSVSYDPPAGILGVAGEKLGAGNRFLQALQHDLSHFAQMVAQAPVGSLDPTSSHYLFHTDSAAAKGQTTTRQNASMQSDPHFNRTTTGMPLMDKDITGTTNERLAEDIDSGSVPAETSSITPERDTPYER